MDLAPGRRWHRQRCEPHIGARGVSWMVDLSAEAEIPVREPSRRAGAGCISAAARYRGELWVFPRTHPYRPGVISARRHQDTSLEGLLHHLAQPLSKGSVEHLLRPSDHCRSDADSRAFHPTAQVINVPPGCLDRGRKASPPLLLQQRPARRVGSCASPNYGRAAAGPWNAAMRGPGLRRGIGRQPSDAAITI